MSQPLTLLHLSDLHFGQALGVGTVHFDQTLVTDAILEDTAALRQEGLQADRVLISGDIALSGKAVEYTLAQVWLERLAATLGIGLEQFFIVPGNHDVDREKAFGSGVSLRKTLTHLRAHPSELDDYLKEDERTLHELKATLWPKLQAYADFSAGFGASHITPQQPFALEKLEWAGKPAYLLGLNTCLLSFDGNDAPANLALGLGQLQRAFEQIPLDALTLVLLHHPPEWLADGGAKRPAGQNNSSPINIAHCLNTFLQKRPHLLLSGHVHEQGGLVAHPLNSGGLLHFVAGAAHAGVGETVPHAYAWLRLRAEGIDYYPRAWNPNRQHFQSEGFQFELERGEHYKRIKREKLSDGLQEVLPPLEEPKTSPERKAQGLELQKAVAHLKRLEKTAADRESIQAAREQVRQLYRKQQQGHLQAADLVDGRYYLLRVLGRGGFATAWLAEDLERKTSVVLKILHSNLVQQEDLLGRFKRGSELMQQLEHPHILRVLESYRVSQPIDGTEDASPHHYVVLEWAEHGDLYQYVLKHHPTWQAVMPMIVACAEALEYAHNHPKRCIHRDVKPHNVLMTAENKIKLTDFDLAKLLDSTFLSSTMAVAAGTAYFSAPEVGEVQDGEEAAEVGPGADVYSLGMTLLFALKGKMISTRESRNLVGEVEKLDVPPLLKDVVLRALEVEPADRYPTMRAFREALERAWGEMKDAHRTQSAVPPTVQADIQSLQPEQEDESTSRRVLLQDPAWLKPMLDEEGAGREVSSVAVAQVEALKQKHRVELKRTETRYKAELDAFQEMYRRAVDQAKEKRSANPQTPTQAMQPSSPPSEALPVGIGNVVIIPNVSPKPARGMGDWLSEGAGILRAQRGPIRKAWEEFVGWCIVYALGAAIVLGLGCFLGGPTFQYLWLSILSFKQYPISTIILVLWTLWIIRELTKKLEYEDGLQKFAFLVLVVALLFRAYVHDAGGIQTAAVKRWSSLSISTDDLLPGEISTKFREAPESKMIDAVVKPILSKGLQWWEEVTDKFDGPSRPTYTPPRPYPVVPDSKGEASSSHGTLTAPAIQSGMEGATSPTILFPNRFTFNDFYIDSKGNSMQLKPLPGASVDAKTGASFHPSTSDP